MITLRFVAGKSIISKAIILDTGGLYSHVEAVTPDGKYLGAHMDGGVLARPFNYDAGQFDREQFISIPVNDDVSNKFYHYLNAVIGEPYDFGAIAGFITHLDTHEKHRVICSALQTLALINCGWLFQLSQPAHQITPRDLFLIVCAILRI